MFYKLSSHNLFNLFFFQKDLFNDYNIQYSVTRGGKDLLNFFKNSNNCNFYSKNLIPLKSKYADKDNKKICNADYLVISNRYNDWDLIYLDQIYKISKKIDKKKLLTIIDKFILKNNGLPNENEIEILEKKYFHSQKNNKYINDMNYKLVQFSEKNKLKILDVSNLFCDYGSERCEIFTKNSEKIIYDSSHFSIEGAKYLGEKAFLTKWLEKIFK